MADHDKNEYYSVKRLRWNTLVFTGGKGVNAVLSLSIFYLIAAHLTKSDFAIYAWLIAFVELATNVSRFGINWAVDRYVPELRSTLNSVALRRFILVMTGLRTAIIIVLALIFYAVGDALLSYGGKEDWMPAFDLYIYALVPFALMVFLRDTVFQSLLKQAHSQSTTTIRHLVFLIILAFVFFQSDQLTLMNVVYGDLVATFIATAASLVQTGLLLRQLPYGTPPTAAITLTWRNVARFAANSYVNEVLRMSGSGYAVMSVAPQMLATAALAPYGFCQTLFAQLNRFLPAHLFSGLYRPRLVAQFTKTGSFEALNRQLVMILKISNYMLALSIAVFFAYGGDILDWVSKGKYIDAHGLMMCFLVLMLVDNHRQVLMALCNILERPEFLSRGSLVMPLVVPLAMALVYLGFGAYGLAIALIIPEICCVGLIVYLIRRAGFPLVFDFGGQARIAAATAVTVVFGLVIHAYHPDHVLWNLAGIALTSLAFIAIARLLRPINEPERAAINRLVGRKVYVF